MRLEIAKRTAHPNAALPDRLQMRSARNQRHVGA
jgi:hypothetical protein